MRVTDSMLYDNSNAGLASELAALQAKIDQVSSGHKLNKPSDNPADVQASISLTDALSQLNQFVRNIDNATSKLSAMDTALSSAGDLMQRANELAIEAANGTLDASQRQSVGAEVTQLTAALAQLANSKVGDDYIFGGFRTDRPPYQVSSTGAVGPYQGDEGVATTRIGNSSTIQVSMPADGVFGSALAALTQLQADLNGGQGVQQTTIGQISAAMDTVVQGQATVGARENRLTDAKTAQQNLIDSNQQLLSQLEDTDMASAITQLSQLQTTYQATLAVTAKVMQTSLIDYLR